MAELRARLPNLNVVIHDDPCHLRKFADFHSGGGGLAFDLAYPQMHYIADRLHAGGHTDKWCLENCQPTNPQNVDKVAGVNTEICKQQFSIMGRFKYMVQSMSRHTVVLFLNEVVDLRNEDWQVDMVDKANKAAKKAVKAGTVVTEKP